MQLQRPSLGVGGKAEAASQLEPTVGHALATVLVREYALAGVPLGVIEAIWLCKLLKSGSLLTELPLTDTRP